MENNFAQQNIYPVSDAIYGTVPIKPDENEKKAIKRRYMIAGLIMLIDVFVFQFVSRAVLMIVGLVSGSPVMEAAVRGREIISSNDIVSVLFTCGFPITAEVISIILAVRFLGIDIKKHFNLKGFTLKDITGGIAATLFCQTAAAFIIVIIMMIFFKVEDIESATLSAKQSLAANVILYTYACLVGPVLEEVLFRGIVLESMRKYNERFAIVFSSVIFGLMHGNFPQAINAMIVGLVLGTLYVRSDSLIPSSVIHILMNTITSLLQVMMYSNPDIITDLQNGSLPSLGGLALAGLAINGIIRLVSIPLGIVVIVISGTKGFGLRKATPAGKSRSAPLVLTSPVWIIVILLYFAICCYNAGMF